jgi:hypothetical protein
MENVPFMAKKEKEEMKVQKAILVQMVFQVVKELKEKSVINVTIASLQKERKETMEIVVYKGMRV